MEGPTAARITDPDRIRNYLSDESAAFHGRAEELYLPASEAEVAEIVRAANESHTLLTVSAGGTSITGSRVPMSGGAVLSMERMVRVERRPPPGFEVAEAPGFTVQINPTGKAAIVPPAITLDELDAILSRRGLAYPPDPTEASANLGGTVATNASGGRSFRYGATRSWVRRLRVVLPTGEIAELRRGDSPARRGILRFAADGRTVEIPLPAPGEYRMPQIKNAAGLYLAPGMEPIDLFIGCEGLAGVITEIEIALIERPAHTLTVVAYFAEQDGVLDFVDSGVTGRAPLDYLSIEYFDGRSLDFMRPAHPDVPEEAAGAVLFEVPYQPSEPHNPYPGNEVLSKLRGELETHGATLDWALPISRREDVRRFRHALPEAVNDFVRRRLGKIGTDMAVPHGRFREMMEAYERESAACGVPFLMFGHIGDDHLHLNYLPEDEDAAARARQAYSRLARVAVELGGTISAEHGVGKKTTINEAGEWVPYLDVQYGVRGMRTIARVKKALDPNCILNIGNMVPAEMLV